MKINQKVSNVKFGGKRIGRIQAEMQAGKCEEYFVVRRLSTCHDHDIRWSLNLKGRDWQKGIDLNIDKNCQDFSLSMLSFVKPPIQDGTPSSSIVSRYTSTIPAPKCRIRVSAYVFFYSCDFQSKCTNKR